MTLSIRKEGLAIPSSPTQKKEIHIQFFQPQTSLSEEPSTMISSRTWQYDIPVRLSEQILPACSAVALCGGER
jgi:hypothetical protein